MNDVYVVYDELAMEYFQTEFNLVYNGHSGDGTDREWYSDDDAHIDVYFDTCRTYIMMCDTNGGRFIIAKNFIDGIRIFDEQYWESEDIQIYDIEDISSWDSVESYSDYQHIMECVEDIIWQGEVIL